MRGYIQKRGHSYRIGISLGLDHETNKYRYSYTTIHGTRKDADKKLRELLTAKDSGTFVTASKTTVADYLETWLTQYAWANLTPRSAEAYPFQVRKHIIPALGHTPLTQLRPENLQKFYSEMSASGVGGRTMQYCHITLHKALSSAVKLGLISRNPADSVDRPRTKPHEMRVLDESGVHKFLEMAKDTPYFSLFF